MGRQRSLPAFSVIWGICGRGMTGQATGFVRFLHGAGASPPDEIRGPEKSRCYSHKCMTNIIKIYPLSQKTPKFLSNADKKSPILI